ncbi:MAG: hypothetical protein R3C19_08210 [Planctomycetaceae bacterium]
MKRSMEVVTAGIVLFAGGSLAGRFIQPQPAASSAPEVASALEAGTPKSLPTDAFEPQPGAIPEAFTEFSDASDDFVTHERAGVVRTVSATGVPHRNDDRIRELVRQHFPDADAQTIEIWCEEYAGIPVADAEFLLQQQKQFRSSLEVSSGDLFRADDGLDVEASDPASPADESLTSAAMIQQPDRRVQIRRDNEANRTTIGFRQRELITLPAALRRFSGGESSGDGTAVFDFRAGRLICTGRPLDVAIDGRPELMFALGSGDMFTRCGALERLDDGRLGFRTPSGELALVDSPVIPENAAAITVDEAGCVTCEVDGEHHDVGCIRLARLADLSRLASDDGVLFSMSGASGEFELVEAAGAVKSGMLELSNGSSDEE